MVQDFHFSTRWHGIGTKQFYVYIILSNLAYLEDDIVEKSFFCIEEECDFSTYIYYVFRV